MRGSCVTNASPSGLRSCMEDEGRPFEVGFREQASNHPKRQKAVVVSVGGKDTCQVRRRAGADDVSKGSLATSKPGALLGQGWGVPDDTGVRHEGGVILA